MAWFGFKKKVQTTREYDITFFPIFAELSPSEINLVESKVRLFELKKGEFVYRCGEAANAFYLILTGRLRILNDHGDVINHLHPGDYFGETSILTNRNHSVTMEVQNDSIVLKIEKEDFLLLLKEIPSLSLHISRTLGYRLTASNERVLSGEAKIISFTHQRPKIGTSMFAIQMANALSQTTQKKVVLLDLSNLGEISESEQGWKRMKTFLLSKFEFVQTSKIAECVVKDQASFHVLRIASDDSLKDSETKLARVLTFFLSHYQFILIDLPAEITPLIRKAIQQSDIVYYLVDDDDKDTEKSKLMIKDFKDSFGFTQDQIRMVLHAKDDRSIGIESLISFDIHEQTLPVFAVLPKTEQLEGKLAYEPSSFHPIDPNAVYARRVRFLARELSGKTVGLALGSGAAFGYAHVGVLKVLEEEGIEIDLIAASSIGAVMGGMWAAGITADQLVEILRTLNRRTTFFKLFGFHDLSAAHRGFFKGDQVVRFLKQHIDKVTFRDLRIPTKIVATDLATGFPAIFDEGLLLDALRASISIPGIFRPFMWGGKYLIDGGISDPLPVQALNRYGAKKVIAVNVLPSPDDHFKRLEAIQKKRQKINDLVQRKNILTKLFYEQRKKVSNKQSANIFNVLMKTIQFMEYGMAEASSQQADITLHPVVVDAHWAEFFSHEKFVQCGEDETRERIGEIKKLISD
ncbi:MAG: patatin-like phospholipase family protein [Candidatus Omnitrophica bacterium]|nr:patatin-like phospholipase family protein [Candidatus Omnitrophota bacterium]